VTPAPTLVRVDSAGPTSARTPGSHDVVIRGIHPHRLGRVDHPSVTPSTRPRTGVVLDERTDEDLETGKPRVAHIVRTEPGESAVARVTEARIYGFPVEALCGERFVPQRDPKKLPMCQVCKEIYDLYRMSNDGLSETPQV
jgi:Protein of unknown function (DUF3039)